MKRQLNNMEEELKSTIGGMTTGEGYFCNLLVNPSEHIYTRNLSEEQKQNLIRKGYVEYVHVDWERHEKVEGIPEELYEEILRVKENVKEVKDAWRRGEEIVFENGGKKKSSNDYEPTKIEKAACSKTTSKKGRPEAEDFETYLLPDCPKGFMDVLEEILDGKKGKSAAQIIVAITNVWISNPPTKSVCNRFPSVKEASFNKAINKHHGTGIFIGKAKPFSEESLDNIRKIIRAKLEDNK